MAATLIELFPVPQLGLILLFVAVNVLLGIAVALRNKRFDWQELPDFLWSRVLPMVLGYATMYASLQVIAMYFSDGAIAPLTEAFALVAGEVATPAVIVAALVQRIAEQVAMLGGVETAPRLSDDGQWIAEQLAASDLSINAINGAEWGEVLEAARRARHEGAYE